MKRSTFFFLSLCTLSACQLDMTGDDLDDPAFDITEIPETAIVTLEHVTEEGDPINKQVEVEIRDGLAIFEGDIILGEFDSVANKSVPAEQSNQAVTKGVVIDGHRWQNGQVPYVFSGLTSNEQDAVRTAMDGLEDVSGVRFVVRSSQRDYIRIIRTNDTNICGQSHVGRRGGRQDLSIRCFTSRTIQHELLHALGFWHEQSRQDRNSHVTIHWENIETGRESSFAHPISDSEDIANYDHRSIMHYHRLAFSRNGQPTITLNSNPNATLGGNVLTDSDRETLRTLYPAPGTPVIQSLSAEHVYCRGPAPRYIISWSLASGGPVSSYDLDYSNSFSRNWHSAYDGTSTTLLRFMSPSQTYTFRVRGRNSNGPGAYRQISFPTAHCSIDGPLP